MATLFNDPILTAVLGKEAGVAVVQKFGRRDGIGIAFEDLAPEAAYAGFIPQANAATLSLVSDNIADDVASTGCQVLRVVGLDENLVLQIKEYDMDGTTPVITTGDLWARVWRLRSRQSSDRRIPNVGAITVASTSAGTPIMAVMAATKGSSLTTNFTMPAGMLGALQVVNTGAGDNKTGEIEFLSSTIVDANNRPFNVELALPVSGGPADVRTTFLIKPKTDIIATGKAIAGVADIFLTYIVYVLTSESVGFLDSMTP